MTASTLIPAELLKACRASGQISDAQWNEHCEERPDLLDAAPAGCGFGTSANGGSVMTPLIAAVHPAPAPVGIRLTKADTVALWHAVDAFSSLVGAMYELADFTPEQIVAERARLVQAKRALRKVNAIRKRQP